MKRLSNVKATVTGDRITICADIVETPFWRMPVERTIDRAINVPDANQPRQHHYHIQVSQDIYSVKTPGKHCGLAISHDDMLAIAKMVDPRICHAPVLKSQINSTTLTADIGSELTPDLQWEVCSDGKTWTAIEGQTTKTLDKSTVKQGQFVRLVAKSEAGTMTSNPIKI